MTRSVSDPERRQALSALGGLAIGATGVTPTIVQAQSGGG